MNVLTPTMGYQITAWIATTLTGLSAGFFAAYYYSVTRAFTAVDDRTYVVVFQEINASIRSVEFGIIFFGGLIALGVALLLGWLRKTRWIWALAFVAYVATLVITMTIHVPLNEALAAVDTETPGSAALGRQVFESEWNRMHTVRTVTVLLAFTCSVFALGRCADVRSPYGDSAD